MGVMKKRVIKLQSILSRLNINRFPFLLFIFFSLCLFLLLSCSPKKETPYGEGELSGEEELEPEAMQEEVEAGKAPEAPKMTEELYIDLTARSALIWDKYKDEPEKAQQEVDNLYLRAGVTWKDYKDFESKLTPQQRDALQKKIIDYLQKIIHEYR